MDVPPFAGWRVDPVTRVPSFLRAGKFCAIPIWVAVIGGCCPDPPRAAQSAWVTDVSGAFSGGDLGADVPVVLAAPETDTGCVFPDPRRYGIRDADVDEIPTVVSVFCHDPVGRLDHVTLWIEISDTRDPSRRPAFRETGGSLNEGSQECGGLLSHDAATATIITARGGLAPYPDIVTDDFERRIELFVPLELRSDACEPTGYALSVAYTQTAEDYRGNAQWECN